MSWGSRVQTPPGPLKKTAIAQSVERMTFTIRRNPVVGGSIPPRGVCMYVCVCENYPGGAMDSASDF